MARPISSSGDSIAGTPRSAPRRSASPASISGPSARTAISGVSRTSRRSASGTPNTPRPDFLRKRGFSKAETAKIVETVLVEEGRPPESVFDFVQGITAGARGKPQQDARLAMETRAKKLLEAA